MMSRLMAGEKWQRVHWVSKNLTLQDSWLHVIICRDQTTLNDNTTLLQPCKHLIKNGALRTLQLVRSCL